MLETSSVNILSGHLNVEWAVRPPSKSVAAMPDEATARAIFLKSNLTFANSKFIRNILPVPPGAPKNSFSSLLIIDDNITS